MSQNLHDLCCLLVEEFYGVFHASLYSTLMPSGRYTSVQIAQKVHLPVRQVKAGLATLVQSRLVYHHCSNDVITYQSNTKSAYNLMRCGKLVELARKQYGKNGEEIVASSFLLGFCTISELAQQVARKLQNPKSPLTNGHSADDEVDKPSQSAIYATIQSMIRDGFLTKIRSAQFQADFDAFGDADTVLKELGIVAPTKGRKGVLEHEMKVEAEKRKRQSGHYAEDGYVPTLVQDEADGSEHRPTKRRKYSALPAAIEMNGGHVGNGCDLPISTLLSVNYHKVVSSVRNEHLAKSTRKSLGVDNDRVLQAALSQVPVTDQQSITEQLFDIDVQALKVVLEQDDSIGQEKTRSRTNGLSESDHCGHLSLRDIDQHLATFAESMFNFVVGGYEKRHWRIDKSALDTLLREKEMLRLIGDRLQTPALRIVRMLMQKGKVDEKTLQEAGLLGAKQLRQTLAELKQMGFIDLQEVPREAQRQPNRTIFLWFHDSHSVQQLLLENIFKTMIRLVQRLKLERKKLASTLEKVERIDVQGSEAHILPHGELLVLQRFRRMEEWLMGELGRLDVSVAILRDL